MVLEWLFTMRRPADERVMPPVAGRRVAATLSLALYPVTQLLVASDLEVFPGLGVAPWVVLVVLAVGTWVASVAVVIEFRRRLANAPDEQLDERERMVRDEAHLIGYRILAGTVAVVALVALLVVPAVTGTRALSLDVVLDVLFSLVVASAILPSAVVAWRDTESGGIDEVEAALPTADDRMSDAAR